MPLTPGDHLGPYEILGLLGKGGMGEVYRAYDDRLRRDVAIKVSNAQFTERFTREARTVASLNHTNIAHLYDVGPNYLVMELVEGEDLKGPLDFEDALPILQQLIDGIEAAHEKNIIHRDLKPANIKITPEGIVKILDFGLAKAMDPTPTDTDPGNSPTLTMGATAVGTILGTAAYMAPEQAKGKQADKRCDIWSFGVIVYELLTGKRMFAGETAVEILGGVLNKDPDISAAPPRVHDLLAWCLEKDRKKRLAAIGDARRMLQEGLARQAEVPSAASTPVKYAGWAAAAVLALVAGYALWPKPAELKPLVRLDLELIPPPTAVVGSGPILSPDGSRMVYSGNGRLYQRSLDQAQSTEIPGTEGGGYPFFSPDGQSVGFYAGGRMKKVSLNGGGAVAVASDSTFFQGGAVWGEDGSIVSAVSTSVAPLIRIPASGGKTEQLGELLGAEGESSESYPQFLPGGKVVLYTGRDGRGPVDDSFTVALSLPGLKRKIVQRNAAVARYAEMPDGTPYLLYVNRGQLSAVRFDPARLETSGSAIPLLDGVLESTTTTGGQFHLSANGTLVYQRGAAGGASLTIQWLDSAGNLQPVLAKPGPYGRPQVSPDGTRLVLDNANDVWTYDWKRDLLNRLTFTGANGGIWSPDNRFVLYSTAGGLGWTRADGGGAPQILIPGQNLLYPWSFTPDGKRLAYLEIAGGGYDIHTVSVENDGSTLKAGKPEPFLNTPADERYPQFSPDGRWLMYTSSESGMFQIYVRAFPDKGGKWQVSSVGGTYPEWSTDGHTIFFRNLDQQLMVANYTAKGDTFTPEKPRLFSDKRIAEVGLARNYALHPDGKRAVVLMPANASGNAGDTTHVTILFNFFDEIKRRAAAK